MILKSSFWPYIYISVIALTPENSTVCLGSSAQFVFAARSSEVASIFYLVNSMTSTEVASHGVAVSAPISIGDWIYVNLTLPGSLMNNNSRITCKAILKRGGIVESSAYLSVQGNVQRLCWHLMRMSYNFVHFTLTD